MLASIRRTGLLLLMAACAGGEPNACEGFADRELGITVEEYRPCAGEILAALDALRPRLQALVAGDSAAQGDSAEPDEIRSDYRKLRDLLGETGIESDYRSLESSTVIVKWPDGGAREFNSAAFEATVQYGAVLAYPNDDNLRQGVDAHERARRAYDRIR